MPDCMMPFPEDWHEFLKDYSFDDSQEVYTNGSRLIPVFRVEQLIKHLLKTQEPIAPIQGRDDQDEDIFCCGSCGTVVGETFLGPPGECEVRNNYCPECGRRVKWE